LGYEYVGESSFQQNLAIGRIANSKAGVLDIYNDSTLLAGGWLALLNSAWAGVV